MITVKASAPAALIVLVLLNLSNLPPPRKMGNRLKGNQTNQHTPATVTCGWGDGGWEYLCKLNDSDTHSTISITYPRCMHDKKPAYRIFEHLPPLCDECKIHSYALFTVHQRSQILRSFTLPGLARWGRRGWRRRGLAGVETSCRADPMICLSLSHGVQSSKTRIYSKETVSTASC